MPLFDLPVTELREYTPAVEEPGDFSAFWADTLSETRAHKLEATFEPVDTGLELVEVYDVTFAGWAGDPVRGWFLVPAGRPGPLPCVVQYQGYGGGRGLPHQWLYWASAGYAHLFMDTRGQGSGWSVGHTPDPAGSAPAHPGFMTRGIEDPHTYYYRRVFADAVRAVEAARSHPLVDPARLAVTGGSQGGGITLAVAGLVPDVAAAMPDVPFLCHFQRAIEITSQDPYPEIARYLTVHRDKVAPVRRTLSYFDGVSFSRRATAPTLFSVGLMDQICPPSTVYAAYNAYAGTDKSIVEYPFNDHEGGGPFHEREQLAWLRARM
ncbi:acetylxylan esterase [Acrocarpospora corrugata]|uniref:Acetylxylan esterase n=1 Tax=Acrocarpospora corrugata TaxID=35763 RepID=A0A5M3W834_9ACTN|nr:acetylxylan esterase [Acrocarpospora corrugata]GES02668.1 acetylxylan esterase [Acrocarpospora corrugata]